MYETTSSATSLLLLAVVDALVLTGASVFTYRTVLRWWRLLERARRTSLKDAIGTARRMSHRQAYYCAVDPNYFLSRMALLFCANIASVTGLVFAAVCVTDAAHSFPVWERFASASLLLFALFSTRSFYRTARLARQVLRIRRNIRLAGRRRRAASQAARRKESGAAPVRILAARKA